MFGTDYSAFAVVAAALVISPGASMAVVTETALERGRRAALLTVAGINIANSSLALSSMLGLSAILHRWPSLLRIVSIGGAFFLVYLGLRALVRAWRPDVPHLQKPTGSKAAHPTSAVARGIMTNLLNPSVVLFYMLLLPQFIRSTDAFMQGFLLLAGTHVLMSLVWLASYALAIGTLSERLARPHVRRIMQIITAAVLLFLGIKLALR
jgi:threonine/homoserine/homoserine lactone efflux protein